MISPVSFRSTASGTNFKDIVNRPQTYIKQDVNAASSIDKSEKKGKSGFGKKLLKLLVGAGLVAGALALGSKYGVFKSKEVSEALEEGVEKGGLKTIDVIKGKLDKAGEYILNLPNTLKGLISKSK